MAAWHQSEECREMSRSVMKNIWKTCRKKVAISSPPHMPPWNSRRLNEEQESWIRSEYMKGVAARDIGRAVGICDVSILARLRKIGVTIRPQGIPSAETILVPSWVPERYVDKYYDVALYSGEEQAAHFIRALKLEASQQ